MTLLFDGIHYSLEQRQNIARESLALQHLGGEQVGFIDRKKGALYMAGGEFCLNATRCLGLILAQDAGLDTAISKTKDTATWQGTVHTSGLQEAVFLRVKKHTQEGKAIYSVAATLPPMHIPPIKNLAQGIVSVHVPGITHMLIDATQHSFSPQHWQKDAAVLRHTYGLEQENAVGCLWWTQESTSSQAFATSEYLYLNDDSVSTEDTFFLQAHPVVAVKNPPTECYERACGSGVLALALMHYAQGKQKKFFVHQPGGILSVTMQHSMSGVQATIDGLVHLVAQGQAFFTF